MKKKIRLVLDIGCSFATAPHAYSYSCARIKRFAKCFVIHIDKWMGPQQDVRVCIVNEAKQTQNSNTNSFESSYYYGKSNRYACLLHRSPLLLPLLCCFFAMRNESDSKTVEKKTLRYIAHIYDYHIVCPTMQRCVRVRALARTPLAHTWYSWQYSRYDSHAPDLNNILFMTFFIVIHFIFFFSTAAETTLVQHTSEMLSIMCCQWFAT